MAEAETGRRRFARCAAPDKALTAGTANETPALEIVDEAPAVGTADEALAVGTADEAPAVGTASMTCRKNIRTLLSYSLKVKKSKKAMSCRKSNPWYRMVNVNSYSAIVTKSLMC